MPASQGLHVVEIAHRLGGEIEGLEAGDDFVVTGAAPIESAGPRDITFLAADRGEALAQRSQAGCILVRHGAPPLPGRCVIRVRDPRLALGRVLGWLHPRTVTFGVHPTAIVHPMARIGTGVSIGPYCIVGADCSIGDNTVFHSRVTVYDGVTIGRRCIVKSGAVLGSDGFGYAFAGDHYEKIPQVGGVEIDDDVEIGANTTIDGGTMVATRIGRGTKIDNLVQIAHNCVVGQHVVIAAQVGIAGGAAIGDFAVIGGQVGIGDRVVVEARAVIGAAAAVPTGKRIRAGEPVWGIPARPLRRYLRQLANLDSLEELRGQLRTQREQPSREATWDRFVPVPMPTPVPAPVSVPARAAGGDA